MTSGVTNDPSGAVEVWGPTRLDKGSMYRQSVFADRALDATYPNWLRIAFLALGRRNRGGHAPFDPGELQRKLGLDREQITKAIRRAVAKGWLDKQSQSTDHRCLIIPLNHVAMGYDGSFFKCKICGPINQ